MLTVVYEGKQFYGNVGTPSGHTSASPGARGCHLLQSVDHPKPKYAKSRLSGFLRKIAMEIRSTPHPSGAPRLELSRYSFVVNASNVFKTWLMVSSEIIRTLYGCLNPMPMG